ncbi:MAG: right-handed parallel beta-helix repeat-containing protein [Planctomycetota bacterium]
MSIDALMIFAVATMLVSATPLSQAHEWFVRAGSEGGDGSQAKPFADPWQALEKCEAGDAIHVTGGKYFGKLGQATWTIPFDNVQLIGGYDQQFKERDPWTNRTELKWDDKSKNPPREARLKSLAKNVTVDGIVIDMKDSASYIDESKHSRRDKPIQGDNAMDFSQAATVRNCVIINPDGYAISAPPGSTIENNLILNAIVFGVSIYTNTGDFKNATATIKNNTILFTWGFKEPGKGAYDGACINVNGPTNITNNILAHSDSNSIYQTYMAEKVSLTKNVFHQNLFSNLKCYYDNKDIVIDDKAMGDLEELGLKAFEGNEVLDPGLSFDPAWLDLYSQRTAYVPGKVTMDDMNHLRQLLGLPILAKGGTPAMGVAPAYDLDKAIDLLAPKNEKCKAGARRVKLESKIAGVTAAAPAKEYPKGNLVDWINQPGTVNDKPMEMVVGVGGVTNAGPAPASYNKEQIRAFKIYDPDGKGEWTTGFLMKGTNGERICNEASMNYDGRGKPETLFVVRGIAYESQGYPKSAFFIESIEKFEPSAATAASRPQGRDWFIVAGSAGGDGSRGKPFKDPWQALEKCEAGDSIHVAEGEYYGKLKIGMWKIDTTCVSLIGGYDKEFKERNPWTHPTLLFCPPDFKGRMRGGYTVQGEGDHTGAVVDGFVFDKRTNNNYKVNGDIDRDRSDATEHIWLFSPGCVIRNCVFLNGNGGALRVCNGQTIENNIFINHMDRTIKMTKGHTSAPSTIKNNTLMFSWELKFGQGRGRGGNLLRLESDVRAIVDNNIFEFADNDAIQLALNPSEVVLTNNVFSHNLWSAAQDMGANVVVDASNFKQLADLGFKKCEGNEILSAGVPVDEKFFSVYLNRTAYVPGKVTMDEWNQIREMLGQPVIATGGQGPEGFMPLYDWKSAVNLVPKNPKCKAGARPKNLDVKFEGIERKEETFEYAESSWDDAKTRDSWDKLDKKRVALKVSFYRIDNQYQLNDISKEQYTCFLVAGPGGTDDGGLPLKCYVKKGTRFERVVNNAKDPGTAKPEEAYIIKGLARENRNMVVEMVERAD